jgi:hypothetical protein
MDQLPVCVDGSVFAGRRRGRRLPIALRSFFLLALILDGPRCVADPFAVFGPQTYQRERGKPVTVHNRFSVTRPSSTRFFLRLTTERARAFIWVNGDLVVRPQDFREGSGGDRDDRNDDREDRHDDDDDDARVTLVEKQVTLRRSNDIAVQVRGRPSATLSVEIVGIDDDPPTITAAATPPANPNGWNNTDVVVSFSCSDAISGIATCPPPVTVTSEGRGQIVTGQASDKAGNTATATLTLNIDKTAPTLAASPSPAPNGNGWNNSDVVVDFPCSDALSGVDTCPGPSTVTTEGRAQVVTGEIVDRAGNRASASLTLAIDKTAPVMTSSLSPAPNAAGWNNSDVTVSFECTDPGGSGVPECPAPRVITTEGRLTLDGTIVDAAGNTATTAVVVRLDRTAPTVTITSPSDGSKLGTPTVTITGTVAETLSGTANVTCDGSPATLSDASFSCDVNLDLGANRIAVEAVDAAGGVGSAHVTITFVNAPKVTIVEPRPLSLFDASPIRVTGTVDDPGVQVAVNGVAAVVSGNTFIADSVTLREGNNLVTAGAINSAGGTGTASVNVVLDTTPPVVHIDAPGEGSLLTAQQVTVTGMINDIVSGTVNADQASVTVNGLHATISNRSFVLPDLLLVRGQNTITAVARDRAGNESRSQVHVTVQDVAGQQRIQMISGNNQTGMIGTPLPEPLVVQLVDAQGGPLADRVITFTVARSDGLVRAFPEEGQKISVRTDDRGQASVMFQLGTRTGVGNNHVSVTSLGISGELRFSASATVGPPERISLVFGENQRGATGTVLPQPLSVIVFDRGGNPVSGVPVTFNVVKGGGSLDGTVGVTRPTDSDGKAAAVLVLGDQEGINNNVVSVNFEGSTGAPVVFAATSIAPSGGSSARVSGVVLDNADTPVPNATARIGDGDLLSAVTNEQGQFTIDKVPVGTVMLTVDGRTSTRPETFPTLAFHLITMAGQDNTIGMPIYLPPIDDQSSKIVGSDQAVVITMKDVPGVAFTVQPRSATFPDGSRIGRVSLSQVHADKVPMPPPNGTAPRIVWTLQPAGVRFNPPVQVQLPNAEGLAPGTVIEVFQFDHDLEQFVSVGPARVSADGSVIVSDPGFGITKSGWGGAPPPPPPPPTEPEEDPCEDAAKDAREEADNSQGFFDNRSMFANIQACIAEQSCEDKENMQDPDWLDGVLPKFIKRWTDKTGAWPAVEAACAAIPILDPFRKHKCAALMAAYHISVDLLQTLIQEGCGTDSDWDRVGDHIQGCIDKESILGPLIKPIISAERNAARFACQQFSR